MEAYICPGLSNEARKAKKEAWDHKTRPTGKTKESSRNYEWYDSRGGTVVE